jgi:hypothetical protein
MSDDLRTGLRELKKKMSQQKTAVLAKPLEKINSTKQEEIFAGYINELSTEFQKSSSEYKYIDNISKEFEGMRLVDVRFAIEKSYDRCDKILSLMRRYEENFDEKEFQKYNSKHVVLEKVLTFMVGNTIGEYQKKVEEHAE